MGILDHVLAEQERKKVDPVERMEAFERHVAHQSRCTCGYATTTKYLDPRVVVHHHACPHAHKNA